MNFQLKYEEEEKIDFCIPLKAFHSDMNPHLFINQYLQSKIAAGRPIDTSLLPQSRWKTESLKPIMPITKIDCEVVGFGAPVKT